MAQSSYYNISPLTANYTNSNIEIFYNNDVNFITTYDAVATNFVGAFKDITGSFVDLYLVSSSNVLIEAIDSISTFVKDNGIIKNYSTTSNNDGDRVNNLVMQTYKDSVTINMQDKDAVIIESGDASVAGDTSVIKISGTDQYNTVLLNDLFIQKGSEIDSNIHIGTLTKEILRFENAINVNELTVNDTFKSAVAESRHLVATQSLFSPNLNLYKDYTTEIDQEIVKVGYAFNINDKNQLELLKYSKFNSNGDDSHKVKKIAVFGQTNIGFDDNSDNNYLLFENANVIQYNGSNQTSMTQAWQINNDESMYYSSGFVGINTYTPQCTLDVVGDVRCTSMTTSNLVAENHNIVSDERLKENISIFEDSKYDDCLYNIKNINLYSFDYNGSGNHVNTGFIAQQVNEILPDAINKLDNYNDIQDVLSINTGVILANLVGAVKSLENRLFQLESK